MDLVFTAGSSNGSKQCINVTIIDDMVLETNEIFTITLERSIASSVYVVALGNNVTGVTITDTDSM